MSFRYKFFNLPTTFEEYVNKIKKEREFECPLFADIKSIYRAPGKIIQTLRVGAIDGKRKVPMYQEPVTNETEVHERAKGLLEKLKAQFTKEGIFAYTPSHKSL